ncbi:hypothetical protein E3N88_15776 [Mikania micrantha]|uniref:Uncharacterized protein n=1 Tax=Mikania micrantha TaxID=192012 RepID=A0A5N6NZ46_9ASTR|nr:hypothetical protein E3N88_15776 [Mikania micrantha]
MTKKIKEIGQEELVKEELEYYGVDDLWKFLEDEILEENSTLSKSMFPLNTPSLEVMKQKMHMGGENGLQVEKGESRNPINQCFKKRKVEAMRDFPPTCGPSFSFAGLNISENKSKEAVYESEPEEEYEENENDYATEDNDEDFKYVEVQDATMEKLEFENLQDSSIAT